MGEEYSYSHAACLATQLPKGARCRAADDPHDEWDDKMWALWRIERNTNLMRWGSGVRYEGEEAPKPMPYPGQESDKKAARLRFEVNKAAVDAALGMNGGDK
ncbi:MAG: hypothetical protein IJI16_04115 [Atopobiaceae bacterium]|nr:hypothetical protein [Atopobiaceae bacterium]